MAVWDGFERDFVKYGNMIGVPFLVALVGLIRLVQRRKSTQRRYVPLGSPEAT